MKSIFKLIGFLLLILLSLNTIYSIKYFPVDNKFEILDFKTSYDKNYIGAIDFEISSKLSKTSVFYIEVLSVEENLIVFKEEKKCRNSCKISGFFEKTFFGKYVVVITTNFEGRFYKTKIPFLLEIEKAKYDISLSPNYFLNAETGINIKGFISSTSIEPIEYTFDIFPKTAIENVKSFTQICEGSCNFSFIINEKILIDEYFVNIYSSVGNLQNRFNVLLPYVSIVSDNITQSSILNEYKNFNDFFSESSQDNLENYFFNNLENKSYTIFVNLIDKFTNNLKSRSEISYNEILNIEFIFENITIKNIFLKNAKIGEVNLEILKLNYSDNIFKNTLNSFQIIPFFNSKINKYELTYTASGDTLLQCTKFKDNIGFCENNFVKILETIPGQIYTISLPVKNSIFIELNNNNSFKNSKNSNINISNNLYALELNTSLVESLKFKQKTNFKSKSIIIKNEIISQDEILSLFKQKSLIFDENENDYYFQKVDYNEILAEIKLKKNTQDTQLEITQIPKTVILGEEFDFEIEISKNKNLSNLNFPKNTKLKKAGLIKDTINYFKSETEYVDLSVALNDISGKLEIKDINGKVLDKKIVQVLKSTQTKQLEIELNVEVLELEKLDNKDNSDTTKKENIKIQTQNIVTINFENVTTSKIEHIELINKKRKDYQLKDKTLATDILHVKANEFKIAKITMEKSNFVDEILTCEAYSDNICISGWKSTNLEFTQNKTHVIFNVTHFSAYVAKSSSYEFSVTPSLPGPYSVDQNDQIQIDFLVTCSTGNCGTIELELLIETGFENYDFFEIPGSLYNTKYSCTENPTSGQDDAVVGRTIGFDFPFYNELILGGTVINLDTNGRLILGPGSSDYNPTPTEMSSGKQIATIWSDLGNADQNNEFSCINKSDGTLKYSQYRFQSTWYNNAGSAESEIILYENGNILLNHGTLATKSGVFTGISAGDSVNTNYFQTDTTDYSSKSYIYYRNSGTIMPTTNSSSQLYTTSPQTQNVTLTAGQNQVVSYIVNASDSTGIQTIFARAKSQISTGIRSQTSNLNILINDGIPPSGTLTSPINNYIGASAEFNINFLANVQDNIELNSATLNIWDNQLNLVYQNKTNLSGTNQNPTWTYYFLSAGNYTWNVLVEDESFLTSWASNTNNTLQINIPTLEFRQITNLGDIEIIQTRNTKLTFEVKCFGGDCGDIDISMFQPTSSAESQNFEIDFGTWSNVAGDDADWARKSGVSGSTGTGPYFGGDTTSSPSGANYVYTETSNSNNPNKIFLLEKSGLNLTNKFNINFWYHMFGSNMGNFEFEVFDEGIWKSIFFISGDQGQIWLNFDFNFTPISTVTALRFNVLSGSSWASDVAVDDITLNFSIKTPMPTTSTGNNFYINSTSNTITEFNMLDNETRIISFYIFENGTINETTQFTFDFNSNPYPQYNTQTNISTIKIINYFPPLLNITRLQPIEDQSIAYKRGQYDLIYNISCYSNSDCENINFSLSYESLDSIGEVGSLEFQNNEIKTIKFSNRYNQTPVLLAVPVTDNDDDNNYLIPIIHSINKTHAQISLCEDAGQTTCSTNTELEELNYFIFDIDKSNNYSWIDVGYKNSVNSNGGNSNIIFSKTFTNTPYIFAQSQTYSSVSNQIGVSTWARDITTTSTNIIACDHPGVSNSCDGTLTENIGYVAIDTILAEIIGLNSGTQAISNSAWTPITFTETYTNPKIMIMQNSDTGNQDPQYPWANLLTPIGVDIRYCEQDNTGVCDSHSSETVRWISVEGGFINVNNSIIKTISSSSDSIPVYLDETQINYTNPVNFNLSGYSSIIISFPLFFTGDFDTNYEIFDTNNLNNQTNRFNITILDSEFNINMTTPLNGEGVIVNDTFILTANITCSGFCGDITATARENTNSITSDLTNTSIYSVTQNPQICSPGINGACIYTWTIYSNDIIGNTYNLDVQFSSSVLDIKDTADSLVTILSGPEVIFDDSYVEILEVVANYESKYIDTTISAFFKSQTNLSVQCVSGFCNFITSDFIQNSDITVDSSLPIKFTCLSNTAGNFTAQFELTSQKDIIPNTINISCEATELDLYVNLINQNQNNKLDIKQNKSSIIEFNITCNIIGGCTNTELGIYYLRDFIGEVGETDLENFQEEFITFENSYSQIPIVLAIPVTDNNGDNNGLIPVITNISTSGFIVKLCEDSGEITCSTNTEIESINYYVFDIAKTNIQPGIEVGYINTVNSNGANTQINFNKTFTSPPYIFSNAQTDFDGRDIMAPTSWAHTITTTTAQLIACDHPGTGDTCAGLTAENYVYLAIDTTNSELGELSSGSSSISNSVWTSVSFSENYQNPIMLVSQNSDAGVQDTQYSWAQNLAFNGAQVRYCEQDGIGDCDGHTAEIVVWLALQKGPIYVGTAADNKVSTISGTTPYFTTSTNPLTQNLVQGTVTTVSFNINATSTIDAITPIYGLLNTGIGSQTLNLRTIGPSILTFNNTDLVFDQVYQDESSGIKSNSLYSRYNSINVSIICTTGDCSSFSTLWENGDTILEGENKSIIFLCSRDIIGEFNATFTAISDNSEITNSVKLSCNVKDKQLDIDMITPTPLTQNNLIVYQSKLLQFNVTCKKIGGCNNVNVSAQYLDDTIPWWNLSWDYKHPITITSSVNTPINYQLLVSFNESNIGPNFDWDNSCKDLRFIKSISIELNYWIESCDSESKNAQVWVKADEVLSVGSPYIFEMYYSNSDAVSKSNANNVFKINSIFHMTGKCTRNNDECDILDNESEANIIKSNIGTGNYTIDGTGYISDIYQNSNLYSGDTTEVFFRYRTLFIPTVGGNYSFEIESNDGAIATTSNNDMYGSGLNATLTLQNPGVILGGLYGSGNGVNICGP